MVDDLVKFGIKHDQELVDGIQWLDGQAKNRGISFYEMVYECLQKNDSEAKAEEWLRNKQSDTNVGNKN